MIVRLTILLAFFVGVSFAFAQNNPQIRTIDSLTYANNSFYLNQYSHKKQILTEPTTVITALSFFPELKNTKISFKEANIKTTMNTRPSLGSLLFRKKENRHYIIRINTNAKDSSVLFKSVPFNAKIGLLGHEFCHILDYNTKSLGKVVGRLFDYSSEKRKEVFEKEIDLMTIKKGLGWQLYDWSFYVLNHSNATEKYKAFKEQIYMEPAEIKVEILSK